MGISQAKKLQEERLRNEDFRNTVISACNNMLALLERMQDDITALKLANGVSAVPAPTPRTADASASAPTPKPEPTGLPGAVRSGALKPPQKR